MKVLRNVLVVLALLVAGFTAFDFLAPEQAVRFGLSLEQRRSGVHEASADIPGFTIRYYDGGAGEPVVLIHGFGADKTNFLRTARFLTPHYRVLIPDLPGYGDSSKPDTATYAIDEQVERLRQFVQALGLKRVHLGGSSMGGHISTVWAGKYPDEVASLWLLGPGGTAAAYDSELRRRYKETGEILLVARTPEDHARIRQFVMSKPPWLPYSFKHVLGAQAAANYPLHSKIFAALSQEVPVEKRFTRIDVPALVVWGTEDRALNPKGAETLKALMPGAKIILMPGVGHLPMVEATAQTAADYLAFRMALQ